MVYNVRVVTCFCPGPASRADGPCMVLFPVRNPTEVGLETRKVDAHLLPAHLTLPDNVSDEQVEATQKMLEALTPADFSLQQFAADGQHEVSASTRQCEDAKAIGRLVAEFRAIGAVVVCAASAAWLYADTLTEDENALAAACIQAAAKARLTQELIPAAEPLVLDCLRQRMLRGLADCK